MPFTTRADLDEYTPKLMTHFERWGMEVLASTYSPPKDSKSGVLFVRAPLPTYTNKRAPLMTRTFPTSSSQVAAS